MKYVLPWSKKQQGGQLLRILQNNNYPKVVCPRCNSELGVFPSDFSVNNVHGTASVLCKACHHSFAIPYKDIPADWREQIFED